MSSSLLFTILIVIEIFVHFLSEAKSQKSNLTFNAVEAFICAIFMFELARVYNPPEMQSALSNYTT